MTTFPDIHVSPRRTARLTFEEFVQTLAEKEGVKQKTPGTADVWELYLADALTAAAAGKKASTSTAAKAREADARALATKQFFNDRWKSIYPKLFRTAAKAKHAKLPAGETQQTVAALLANKELDLYQFARQFWIYSRQKKTYVPAPEKVTPTVPEGVQITDDVKTALREILEAANAAWRTEKKTLLSTPAAKKEIQQNFQQYHGKALVFVNGKFRFTHPEIQSKDHQRYADTAYQIALGLVAKNTVLKGKVFHATGDQRVRISDAYELYGGIDRTVKADIISIPPDIRLSVKHAGGSQIAAGQSSDALAMFNLAKDRFDAHAKDKTRVLSEDNLKVLETTLLDALRTVTHNISPKALTALATVVDVEHFDKKGSTNPGLKAAAEQVANKTASKKILAVVQKYPEIQTFFTAILGKDEKIKNDVGGSIVSLLNDTPEFRNMFVFENATGAGKFGGANASVEGDKPYGSANYLLSFSPTKPENTTANKIEDIANWQSENIATIAKDVTFKVRWRHVKSFGVTTAFKIELPKKANESRHRTFESRVQEELDTFLLSEGMFDSIKGATQTITAKVQEWWRKFNAWWQQLIQKAVQWLRDAAAEGLSSLLSFLGLEAEAVSVTGPDWLLS